MKILFLEGFNGGSHNSWACDLIKHSNHNFLYLSLPGKSWKWRMQGGAISLAKEFMKTDFKPDLIFATDMIDLSLFLSLTRKKTAAIPTALYFHENQLNYPWSPNDKNAKKGDIKNYSFINYTSALNADKIFFNSNFHMNQFLGKLPDFLQQYPDFQELENVEKIKEKSSILHISMELSLLEKGRDLKVYKEIDTPLILWNHRWEHDKNPKDFFDVLYNLDKKKLNFKLAILGESPFVEPKEFVKAKKLLSHRIVQYGFASSRDEYAAWLWAADILPVTSNHDFFGISTMEATYCETIPLLPKRLTYPELFDNKIFESYFYNNEEIEQKLESLLLDYKNVDRVIFKKNAERFDWNFKIDFYDDVLEKVITSF